MIVIGSGIGGLLVGALYRDVTLFEKDQYLGGRFRNVPYKGFQLTTGALHMIPHGATGPLAHMLQKAGVMCPIIDSDPEATFYYQKNMRFKEVLPWLTSFEKMRMYAMVTRMRFTKGNNIAFKEFLEKKTTNDIIIRGVKSFCMWALSVDPSQVPCCEMFALVKSLLKYGGPGVPVGGCSGVINGLHQKMKENKNVIIHKKIIDIIADDHVQGVIDEDGKEYYDDIVVSDIGAKATSKLVSFPKEYQKKVDSLQPSMGIKYSIACKTPLLLHNGVMLTPGLEHISGVNQVTNIDPSLAPKGWHLVMAHQSLNSANVKKEKEKGLEDLEVLFKGMDYQVLGVHVHKENNPVNHAVSGQDMDQKTPVAGLYLVGDSAKGKGGMEVEGIALGVNRLIKLIQ
ncbi:MAG: NAD(P)-binding protein [Candidatus Methanofastidiosia archaeon]